MKCPCGHDSFGTCLTYAEQDDLIDASIAHGEREAEVTTCPKCRDSWTADVPAENCDCESRRSKSAN